MQLEPGGLIAWLVVGVVAGMLAGMVTRGGGFGLIGDLVVGLIGAFIGGLVFSYLLPISPALRNATGMLPGSSTGLVGSIIVAFLGALVLIALLGGLTRRRTVVIVNE